MRIEEHIPIGRENAVSRGYLSALVGCSDREVRRMIEAARNEGIIIVNEGNGYFQTDDLETIERAYRTDRARALSTLKRLKVMRRTLKKAGRI